MKQDVPATPKTLPPWPIFQDRRRADDGARKEELDALAERLLRIYREPDLVETRQGPGMIHHNYLWDRLLPWLVGICGGLAVAIPCALTWRQAFAPEAPTWVHVWWSALYGLTVGVGLRCLWRTVVRHGKPRRG
jgi:hypothetical protein